MRLPLEITYRWVEKTEDLDTFIRDHAAKLDRFNDHIMSCRVAIERPNESLKQGSGWRVRLDVTVPPRHELAVVKEPSQGEVNDSLFKIIDEAFEAMKRQVQKLAALQRGDMKRHPQQEEGGALVHRLFENHGFLRDLSNGDDIYFHRNAVVGTDFDSLDIGMRVNCVILMGEEGPQASTVKVVQEAAAPLVPRNAE